MMNIENYKKKLESMSKEELLHEISNLISDHGIQLQDKCNEIQELKSALARADLQFQFQIGEVDLRDKEIESLKGKRKPEDNEVLNILNNFSEVAYKQGCANNILKVIDYINWQNAEIERLTEVRNELVNMFEKKEAQSKLNLENWNKTDRMLEESDLRRKELATENAELQKKVNELTEQLKKLKLAHTSLCDECADYCPRVPQAVKNTAKEICVLLEGFGIDAMLEAIRETYGIER